MLDRILNDFNFVHSIKLLCQFAPLGFTVTPLIKIVPKFNIGTKCSLS